MQNAMKKGPYKVLSSKTVYKNPWIEVREDNVVRKGKKSTFGIINYKPGISVVALDKDKNIYLVREFYYAINEYGIQVPSGGIEKGQSPLDAAKTELLEETGLVANNWISLGFVHPLTMILNSPAYLFLVLNVRKNVEPEKGIELVKMPFEEAYKMVLDGKIVHAPSCVVILKAKIWLDKNR